MPRVYVAKHPRNVTHGHASREGKSPTYIIWWSMRSRCEVSTDTNYKRYGAKGISVCERWKRFENFLSDMGERPPGLTIERNDSSRHYGPDNCRWATRKEQTRNRSVTKFVTLGDETRTIQEWADRLGLKYSTLYMRLRRGQSAQMALQP